MPESATAAALIVLGLALLIGGGEMLVRGATNLAAAARISPLVIGLTVVAFGTSTPELAVSLRSAWAGNVDLAIGNVVGSNIFNVLLILGLSAVIAPLVVSSQLIRFDVPVMIFVSILLLGLGLDGRLSRVDGALLLAGLVAYLGWTFLHSRKNAGTVDMQFSGALDYQRTATVRIILWQAMLILFGLLLLTLGSHWLVSGAVTLARVIGISELIIGLTIVAAGTSLPEVATSILAAVRGQRDIAVGNVVGSNIFNILLILGMAGLVSPSPIYVSATALRFDIPVMIAVAFACLPIFFTGRKIARWEGALFLGYFVTYMAFLVLHAFGGGAVRTFGLVMTCFVIPLTCVTLLVTVLQSLRQRDKR